MASSSKPVHPPEEQVKKENSTDDFLTLFNAFIRLLERESDRGSVIVSCALLDDALEQRLKYRLAPSPEKEDELFAGAYAPLNNFSAKIDFAYRVGVISLNTRKSLHLIRKLRNDFAHSSSEITFKTESVRHRIKELFRLTTAIFNFMGVVIKKHAELTMQARLAEIASHHGADYMLKLLTPRQAYEILVSILATALQMVDNITSLTPLITRWKNK